MHARGRKRGNPCIDSQVWARNHESMQEAAHLQPAPQHIPQHVFHHALTTSLALEILHAAGSTQVRQWRQKRVLMRLEAAFPYVFAAEGAQHPPKKPPRSTTIAAATAQKKTPRNQPKPPQNPPGHSSYTMRGGQTVTPY